MHCCNGPLEWWNTLWSPALVLEDDKTTDWGGFWQHKNNRHWQRSYDTQPYEKVCAWEPTKTVAGELLQSTRHADPVSKPLASILYGTWSYFLSSSCLFCWNPVTEVTRWARTSVLAALGASLHGCPAATSLTMVHNSKWFKWTCCLTAKKRIALPLMEHFVRLYDHCTS